MIARRLQTLRHGRYHQEHALMLVLILVVCLIVVRLLTPEQTVDTRSLWERIVASLLGMVQCFGLLVGLSFILASIEIIKQSAARYRSRRVETKLARLEPILRDAQTHASPQSLSRVLRMLRDGNESVRQQALCAAYTLIRADPSLTVASSSRDLLADAILCSVGFARTMAATAPGDDLLTRVTLGAKLGAGTSEKRLAPVTSIPAVLAAWIETHRRDEINPEIQISVGFDTGSLPYLIERGRFLALYTFVSTTDLKRFQALLRRPPRDPNAAYGLVIRGDVVEVKFPGQSRGHRLDYVFPLPVRLSEANLAALIKQIQLLNLGLFIACVQDLCRVLLPNAELPWLDGRRQAIGQLYRQFERRFVSILRDYDPYREPAFIHRLVPADHGERVRAFESFRLEESLYPYYGWVVPLYDPDTRWERLLAPLRCVEGMLLHQGPVEDREVTRGVDFLQSIRRLGHETATRIEDVLKAESIVEMPRVAGFDPFIDSRHEGATLWYLRQVSRAIERGECCLEDLPDPVTFRQAVAYYQLEGEPDSLRHHEEIPEREP